MAARTIENRRERLATIFVAPFITCSARLPVYALLIGAFVPKVSVIKGVLGLQALALLRPLRGGVSGGGGNGVGIKFFRFLKHDTKRRCRFGSPSLPMAVVEGHPLDVVGPIENFLETSWQYYPARG